MKLVTHVELDALHKLKLELGTNKEIAIRTGISEQHIGRLLKLHHTETAMLESPTWEKLEPLLQKYIDKYASPNKECMKICEGLQDDGKAMITRYKDLDYTIRESINTNVKIEWEKKYGASNTGKINMDHDKHQAS